MFAFECKKDCSKNSSLFYSHLWLVFVVNICNFIQRTSVPLNIFLFGVCVCVLPGTLLYAQPKTLIRLHALIAMQTPIFPLKEILQTRQMKPHCIAPHHAFFHLFQFITADSLWGRQKKNQLNHFIVIYLNGMDVAYD